MSTRPRRSAAQRATAAITDMAADREPGGYGRSRRSADSRDISSSRDRDRSTDRPSSSASAESHHVSLTVKVASSKLRNATKKGSPSIRSQISVKSRDPFVGGEIMAAGKRSTRGGAKKRYVESETDEEEEVEVEEEEEEEHDVIQVGDRDAEGEDDDEMEDLGEEDAEGEADEDMDVDAEGEDEELGEEDAEGDVDMDVDTAPTIKVTKPPRDTKPKAAASASRKAAASSSRKPPARKGAAAAADEEDDDDELSELESEVGDPNDETAMTVGGDELGDEDAEGEEDVDIDAEGEEIEVAAEEEEEEEEEDEELGSDNETPGGASREETPDFTKMTKRQRARFEDEPQEYMKLSDEVQVKKVFTAEELSMRRAEMARRRRNLSEKRNEEVKMETINKLLKKQPTKNSKRAAAENDSFENETAHANPMFIRWVSNKDGCHVSVPVEIIESPVGKLFASGAGRKMVQEV